jgi:hypothetical protein
MNVQMTRIRLFDPFALVVCLVMTCGASMAALQKPAFSGTWIIQPPNKAAGQEMVIKQDDKTLAITSGGRTMTHQLDGVERKESRPMRGGAVVQITKAEWAGKTIVITTSISYPNNMKTSAKEVWSIDDQGQLVMDFTETAEGQPPRVMKVTHKKKN